MFKALFGPRGKDITRTDVFARPGQIAKIGGVTFVVKEPMSAWRLIAEAQRARDAS